MKDRNVEAVSFKAGMYLLETLTSGMYNDPLSIYREYIQNSVDSIDLSGITPDDAEIKITLDPFLKSVTIFDNGTGISAKKAEGVLSSIGSSEKLGTTQRGFRGIGRLGGIAFAKKVIFRTTAKGESEVSTQVWNCEELRVLLRSPVHATMSIEELFSEVATFSQETVEELTVSSFFEVQLLGVESFRNYILDIQKIKKFLMQVAPLPFDADQFSFHQQVQRFLVDNVPHYNEYKITVNDEQLFKSYKDELIITSKQQNDHLESVELFSLSSGDTLFAHGWYGRRKELLGSIRKGEAVSGIRVKVGNIQVGDHHLLDRCFRENRFNSYVVGEIHVCNNFLLPNSRRDDFVDNKEKSLFYNLIEREVGLSLSKEIRHCSRISSKPSTPIIREEGTVPLTLDESKSATKSEEAEGKPIRFDESFSPELLIKLLTKCENCETLQRILKDFSN